MGHNPKRVKPKSRSERRKARVDRKITKDPDYENVYKSFPVFEELRHGETPKDKRIALVDKILSLYQGNIAKFARKHDASRVLQAMLKHGTSAQKAVILSELKPELVELCMETHSAYVVTALFSRMRDRRSEIINTLRGSFFRFVSKASAAQVLHHIYVQAPRAVDRTRIIEEFYGKDFVIDEAQKPRSLKEVLAEHPSRRESILSHVHKNVLGVVLRTNEEDVRLLMSAPFLHISAEFLANCRDAIKTQEIVSMLVPHVTEFLDLAEGARLAALCAGLATAKERKKMVQNLPDDMTSEMMADTNASLFLCKLCSVLDDTVILRNYLEDAVEELSAGVASAVQPREEESDELKNATTAEKAAIELGEVEEGQLVEEDENMMISQRFLEEKEVLAGARTLSHIVGGNYDILTDSLHLKTATTDFKSVLEESCWAAVMGNEKTQKVLVEEFLTSQKKGREWIERHPEEDIEELRKRAVAIYQDPDQQRAALEISKYETEMREKFGDDLPPQQTLLPGISKKDMSIRVAEIARWAAPAIVRGLIGSPDETDENVEFRIAQMILANSTVATLVGVTAGALERYVIAAGPAGTKAKQVAEHEEAVELAHYFLDILSRVLTRTEEITCREKTFSEPLFRSQNGVRIVKTWVPMSPDAAGRRILTHVKQAGLLETNCVTGRGALFLLICVERSSTLVNEFRIELEKIVLAGKKEKRVANPIEHLEKLLSQTNEEPSMTKTK